MSGRFRQDDLARDCSTNSTLSSCKNRFAPYFSRHATVAVFLAVGAHSDVAEMGPWCIANPMPRRYQRAETLSSSLFMAVELGA
ncbi:hypothetical protein IQ06DRAFT_296223 [Phaeosphaeriaceae sp. SRC1lsM3a]|nr:hypothetical protein IQ06DRAFT_296223 [Stagonospora sp. SRC1lsM3a]